MESTKSKSPMKTSKNKKNRGNELVNEMEDLAADVRYWDIPLRSALFVRDPLLDIHLSSSRSYLDAISINRSQLVSNHPQRRTLDPKVIELEVDALIALKRAQIALVDNKPPMAKKYIRQARGLIEQSIAVNPEKPIGPRSMGGKTTAAKRQARMTPIIEFCALEIRNGTLTDIHLRSQPILAEELLGRVKREFHDQLDQLPPITFSTITALLKLAKGGRQPSQVRQAYDARVKPVQKSSRAKAGS
jgi:hypothetical protein